MALEMIVEADERLTRACIEHSLERCGARLLKAKPGLLRASFPSGMGVYSSDERWATDVLAFSNSEAGSISWRVVD